VAKKIRNKIPRGMVYDNSFTQEQREEYDLMKAFGLPLSIKEYFSLEDKSLDGIRAYLKFKL
jgi:BarA-like signal transduction histidine kinase